MLEPDINFTPDVFDDTYLNMELVMPIDDHRPDFSKVTRQLRDRDRLPIGRAHNNTTPDTRMYEVEYKDGKKLCLQLI